MRDEIGDMFGNTGPLKREIIYRFRDRTLVEPTWDHDHAAAGPEAFENNRTSLILFPPDMILASLLTNRCVKCGDHLSDAWSMLSGYCGFCRYILIRAHEMAHSLAVTDPVVSIDSNF